MDSSGFQNNMSNRARVCTSVPGQNVDVGQTTPDASVVVHGELMDYTQPPTFPGDTSILDSDGASCFFNQADLAHGQLSSANGSMNLAEQSRPPVQCTSPNRSLDILVQQAQRPTAQPCIETMLTPGYADQVLCQQGQLPFAASADPASGSNSQNLFGFCHGEKQGHPGLLQQRHFSQLDHQMVSFTESYHSEHPKYAMPNSQEMAEQGFTYCGDGTYKCDACNVKLSTKQSPIASDILKNHQQLCRREMHFHSPQEQMLPKTSEHDAMVFAKDENGHSHVLHGPVKRPEYAAYDKRVESFHNKPFSAPKTPRELASAGLYFLCEPDHVVCFSCGFGFRNWEPDDDPWGEHARLYPNCTFVKQVLHHSASAVTRKFINYNKHSNEPQPKCVYDLSTSNHIDRQ
ncbi:hypothetical protein ACJMK2_041183 [Sinanodonta woodiana]|uniref:Uncharacterized protein n=1 Tax=Sinanodonta woodiana TaxID=1069815 RepID=A0ABD3W3B5_SINWO